MSAQIIEGDVFDVLPTLAPGSVDCCVTSPPYWMLRSYLPKGHALKPLELGSEPTPAIYVQRMIQVLRLVRDALAPHGTVWLNIGDTYSCSAAGKCDNPMATSTVGRGRQGKPDPNAAHANEVARDRDKTKSGIDAGNLCLIPWRLAIAAQDDGWLVRSIIVWHKPAPMPSSVQGWSWRRCRVKVKDGTMREKRGDAHRPRLPVNGQGYNWEAGAGATAQWSDCPGCPKCCNIKGGSDGCLHEWELPKTRSCPLPLQAEAAVVENAGKAGAVPDVQINNLAVEVGSTSPGNQNAGQRSEKQLADGAETDSSVSPDRTVPVKKAANKVRKKRGGDIRKHHDVGLPRQHAEHPQTLGEIDTAKLDAIDQGAVLGELFAQRDGRAEPCLDELDQREVCGGEIERASVADVSVSENQPKGVSHVLPPLVKETNVDSGLPSDESAEPIALRGAERVEVPSLPPGSPVELLSASETLVMGTAPTTSVGAVLEASSLGGNNAKVLSAHDASNDGRHEEMVCTKCGAVKYPSPHAGLVLRRGSWRPTSSWEPVLLLAKGSGYYADGDAVKQTATSFGRQHTSGVQPEKVLSYANGTGQQQQAGDLSINYERSEANLRDVWTIAAEPLKEKHYASFPSELVYRCLAAGTSARGYCPGCGKPWARVVETTAGEVKTGEKANGRIAQGLASPHTTLSSGTPGETRTLGWRQTCPCPPHEPRPGRVLDPFGGSQRTGIQARRLGLDYVSIELNPEYCDLGRRLLEGDSPLFNTVG